MAKPLQSSFFNGSNLTGTHRFSQNVIGRTETTPEEDHTQRNIDIEMANLTSQLQLTRWQQTAVKAAIEAIISGTTSKSLDQILNEKGSPRQLAAWKRICSRENPDTGSTCCLVFRQSTSDCRGFSWPDGSHELYGKGIIPTKLREFASGL